MHKRVSSRVYILTAFLISGIGGISHRLLIGWRRRASCRTSTHNSAHRGSRRSAYHSTRIAYGDAGSTHSECLSPPRRRLRRRWNIRRLLTFVETGGWVNSEPFTLDEMQDRGQGSSH